MENLVLIRSEVMNIIILIYLIAYDRYYKDGKKEKDGFIWFAIASMGHCIFGLITEIIINSSMINSKLNDICHYFFFFFVIFFCFQFFRYAVCLIYPENKQKNLIIVALVLCISAVVSMPFFEIKYVIGYGTNYSAGIGVNICYAIGFLNFISADILLYIYRKQIKRTIVFAIFPISLVSMMFMIVQLVFSEFFFTESLLTITTIAIFFAIENPIGNHLKQAYIDSDTHTKKRNSYDEYCKEIQVKLEENPSYYITYVICDINSLKEINDEYGHIEGDRMIYTAAHNIRHGLKSADAVFRIGGDEFAVIYTGSDVSQVEKEIASVRKRCESSSASLVQPLAIAVGYAVREKGESFAELVKRADLKMYDDKERYYTSNGRERRR